MHTLSREEALALHREMWTAMQKELGDTPAPHKRIKFKMQYCDDKFGRCAVNCSCFLCEYVFQNHFECDKCPIDWSSLAFEDDVKYGTCLAEYCNALLHGRVIYEHAPISEILALPEREVKE